MPRGMPAAYPPLTPHCCATAESAFAAVPLLPHALAVSDWVKGGVLGWVPRRGCLLVSGVGPAPCWDERAVDQGADASMFGVAGKILSGLRKRLAWPIDLVPLESFRSGTARARLTMLFAMRTAILNEVQGAWGIES